QQPGIHLEVLATQAALDHYLPEAHGAEDELTTLRVDQVVRSLGQAVRLAGRPQQQVRIQLQLHGSSPNSRSILALPIRSKSSGTASCPAMNGTTELELSRVVLEGRMAERVGFEPTCRFYPTIRFRVGAVMTASVPLRPCPNPSTTPHYVELARVSAMRQDPGGEGWYSSPSI